MKKIAFISLVMVLLGACSKTTTSSSHNISLVSSAGQTLSVQVELADTMEQQERGLMERTSVPEGQGMLFRFQKEQSLGFWMKDTLIPLDIIFFDHMGKFVSSTTMPLCTSDPCPPYYSKGLAMYAIELPAGYIQKHLIDSSWSLTQLENLPPQQNQ